MAQNSGRIGTAEAEGPGQAEWPGVAVRTKLEKRSLVTGNQSAPPKSEPAVPVFPPSSIVPAVFILRAHAKLREIPISPSISPESRVPS